MNASKCGQDKVSCIRRGPFDQSDALGVVTIPINISIIRVMRVLRIARVLKLLKTAKGVRRLLETVAHALPQVGNLGLLFLLLFFIFAALGVELFGTIGKLTSNLWVILYDSSELLI